MAFYLGENSLAESIYQSTAVSLARCYQCGKCSAGCAHAREMDYTPSLLFRMLQTETRIQDERVLGAYAIWLCMGCDTCNGRCPQQIDIPKIMNALRVYSLESQKVHPQAKGTLAWEAAYNDLSEGVPRARARSFCRSPFSKKIWLPMVSFFQAQWNRIQRWLPCQKNK